MSTQPEPPLRVSIIDSEQAFLSLASDWNRLVKQCKASVFFRHEWFEAAWAWRKQDSHLFILLAQCGEEIVGILPLIRTAKKQRFLTLRCVEFLTVPDTQICDLIIAPQRRVRVIDIWREALDSRRGEWDLLHLRYLNGPDTAASELAAALTQNHYVGAVKAQGPNLFVALDGSWDRYYTTRTRSLKKANNLAANRLKKLGQIKIEWITHGTASTSAIDSALAQAIDISRRSWKQNTGNSLDQPGPNGFITKLTGHAIQNGWLSLWLLSLNDNVLAMEYQLLDAGNVYALRADFDAQCEEISPGSHLMRTLLETLFDRGLQRYYMGPGDNAYKGRWTNENDALFELVVYGNTLRGKCARLFDDVIKPLARSLRDRIAPQAAHPADSSKKEPSA